MSNTLRSNYTSSYSRRSGGGGGDGNIEQGRRREGGSALRDVPLDGSLSQSISTSTSLRLSVVVCYLEEDTNDNGVCGGTGRRKRDDVRFFLSSVSQGLVTIVNQSRKYENVGRRS